MATIDARPYLTSSPESVRAEPWMHERAGLPELLPQQLADWDPIQDVKAQRTVNVDLDRIRTECGLGNKSEVAVAVSWRSPGSGQRGSAFRRTLHNGGVQPCVVTISIPGVELAGSVRLFTRVVLDSGAPDDAELAAFRKGAILWEDDTTLILEGIGSRFPIQVVEFEICGLPPSVAWSLNWSADDMNAQAMGCVCLLLNKRHSRVVAAATKSVPDGEAKSIWSAINVGVARELIVRAIHDETFLTSETKYDQGSVGDVVLTLIARAFPGLGPKAVLDHWNNNPERFDCDLQAAFHLFN